MSTLSLSQYLCREQQLHDLDPVLSRLIVSVSEACKTISFKVRNGALAGVLGMAGSENVQGEDQKKLDIISNDIFVEAVALSGSVCGMVSEEIPEVIPVPEDLPIGPYLICFDPLDGSSNIEVTDGNIKSFERTASKYGLDFALKKDVSVEPPSYLVFFKGRDVDVMTAAFKEFSAKTVKQKEQPSIRHKLDQEKAQSKAQHKEKVKVKTKDRGVEL